ncbi:hypothetical protein RUM44_013258 [Polyplax serrata]|uniref:GAR domain-containing protein n=1 Tax=Polyplax serrata TaxID=468196 RepID=A0ABR1BDM7_POLSC
MIRVSEGKYRIGDTKVLIFVRILRSHVMVRVGGGWDTLSHYLDKHDPCRCRTGHKAALSSKLILKNTGAIELNNAQVQYERSPPRTRRSSASSSSSGHGGRDSRDYLSAYGNTTNRSRSPTPKRETKTKGGLHSQKYVTTCSLDDQNLASPKRDRSVSPGARNRPSFNAPTLASRNRSRSPSIRGLDRQKKKISEIQAKQNDVSFYTANQLNEPIVEQARRARIKLEAKDRVNHHEDGKQNDSESEVSDEGYRSLGLIVTSPTIGEGKIVANDMKSPKRGHNGTFQAEDSDPRESPNSEGSFASNEYDHHFEEVKKLPKKSVSRMEGGKSLTKIQSPVKKTSRSSSPNGNRESQVPVRRYSVINESDTYRRKANKENEIRKNSRSRSATPGRHKSVEVPLYNQHSKTALAADKYGTWNGKSKKRSELHPDSYGTSNFVRNGVGRSSLGASSTTYDPTTGRRIWVRQQEQKNMSPLLTDLLKTKNLDDDKSILLKMREIINQYSGIFEDDSGGPETEDLDFTSEWVRNNGNLRKMESGDFDEKSSPNKRKDSKYDGTHSKIPAPVYFKQQQISEKEC